jgi:hypothetical protein
VTLNTKVSLPEWINDDKSKVEEDVKIMKEMMERDRRSYGSDEGKDLFGGEEYE